MLFVFIDKSLNLFFRCRLPNNIGDIQCEKITGVQKQIDIADTKACNWAFPCLPNLSPIPMEYLDKIMLTLLIQNNYSSPNSSAIFFAITDGDSLILKTSPLSGSSSVSNWL
jgi:hypothetical protein